MRHHLGGEWPDLSRRTMLAELDDWLLPFLTGATCRADLEKVDLVMVMQSVLGWDKSSALDRLAPATYEPPRGRPCSAIAMRMRSARSWGTQIWVPPARSS